MAPENPPSLVIFDARLVNQQLLGSCQYIEPSGPRSRLRVRWAVESQPEGFAAVGGGVAYVYAEDGEFSSVPISNDAIPIDLGENRYRWIEGLNVGVPWVMFILILPPGHTLSEASPTPAGARVFQERLALYWVLRGDDLGRTAVSWTLDSLSTHPAAELLRLNRLLTGPVSTHTTLAIEDATHVVSDVPRTDAAKRSVIISLHGIRTRGVWQKELTTELNRAGFDHSPLDFGFFLALRMLWPPARRRQVNWFRDQYTTINRDNAHAQLSVIAHSFGTYLVAATLERFPEVTFERVIFCGSIVGRAYPWTRIIHKSRQVRKVLNDYGYMDLWAGIVGWLVEDAGPSGTRGFTDDAEGDVVQRGHPEFKHSDYFYVLNYEKNWIPFLKGLSPGPLSNSDRRPVNWGFRATVSMTAIVLLASLTVLTFAVRSRPTLSLNPQIPVIVQPSPEDVPAVAFRSPIGIPVVESESFEVQVVVRSPPDHLIEGPQLKVGCQATEDAFKDPRAWDLKPFTRPTLTYEGPDDRDLVVTATLDRTKLKSDIGNYCQIQFLYLDNRTLVEDPKNRAVFYHGR